MPKTNAQRQQEYRRNRKKIQQSETLDTTLARKKIDAERSKRYRDRLKSRRQHAKLESGMTDGQFQIQMNQIPPSMNYEVQQVISPNVQSLQASYEEHDECLMPNALLRHETNIDGDVSTSETQEHRSIPKQTLLKSYKVPAPNFCKPFELPLPHETCSQTNSKNAIDLSCQDFPISDPIKTEEYNDISSKKTPMTSKERMRRFRDRQRAQKALASNIQIFPPSSSGPLRSNDSLPTSETQELGSIQQQTFFKYDKVPVENSCKPIELPYETCSRTNSKNAIGLSCQDFPFADPFKTKECNEFSSKTKKSKEIKWCEVQLKFVDHVVMIWLRRRLAGHQNLVMLDYMLKAKAKETANLLGRSVSIPCTWLSSFKKKLNDAPNDGLSKLLTGKGPLTIEEIIVDEWPRFCKNEANSSEESDTDDEETMPDAVHTFEEALDCLRLVEGYTLLKQNVRALELISQIKEILKTEVI